MVRVALIHISAASNIGQVGQGGVGGFSSASNIGQVELVGQGGVVIFSRIQQRSSWAGGCGDFVVVWVVLVQANVGFCADRYEEESGSLDCTTWR